MEALEFSELEGMLLLAQPYPSSHMFRNSQIKVRTDKLTLVAPYRYVRIRSRLRLHVIIPCGRNRSGDMRTWGGAYAAC